MKQQLTIGVLGHVDHGKTSLVKALTGTDTDRLAEEKSRGLSIVLGFAYLETPQGMIDLIDVPGHENFIRTMIAGATGIDTVMLVVAADEGIKPQTREHVDIARLLGIRRGFIVISKTDLVDQNRITEVTEQLREYGKGMFLENAPIYPVSADNGNGIEELKTALTGMTIQLAIQTVDENFYLPLDRVFTIAGFGTVGTGTLRNGKIRVGDEIAVMPADIRSHVRELQVHNDYVDEALPGQRVAVNLRNIKREQLNHGDVLITPGSLQATSRLYASLQILDSVPRIPKRHEAVRLLFGTREIIARLRILNTGEIQPGTEVLVQISCQQPIIANIGEPFIVRTCSPVMTIGGGKFLEISPESLNIPRRQLISFLQRIWQLEPAEKVRAYIDATASSGIDLPVLARRIGNTRSQLNRLLGSVDASLINESVVIANSHFETLCKRTLQYLKDDQSNNMRQSGLNLDQLRSHLLPHTRPVIVEHVIKVLTDNKQLSIQGNKVKLSGADTDSLLSNEMRKLISTIERIFKDSGTMTPALEEVVGKNRARQSAYQYLTEQGKLIPLKAINSNKMIILHSDTLENIKQQLLQEYPPPKQFTVAEIRSLLDSSRKYVVPILEYFDRMRLTIRRGDYRTLTTAKVHNTGNQAVV